MISGGQIFIPGWTFSQGALLGTALSGGSLDLYSATLRGDDLLLSEAAYRGLLEADQYREVIPAHPLLASVHRNRFNPSHVSVGENIAPRLVSGSSPILRCADANDPVATKPPPVTIDIKQFSRYLVQVLGGPPYVIGVEKWQAFKNNPTDGMLQIVMDAAKEKMLLDDDKIQAVWVEWKKLQASATSFSDGSSVAVAEAVERINTLTNPEILKDTLEDLPAGIVMRRHDDELGTDIHFVVTSKTKIVDGHLTEIPEDAKAIVVWFHGSGSNHAHGGNFWQEMSGIASHDIASIGFDYPYHGNGPRDDAFRDLNYFSAWVEKIVSRYRERYPDKKIVLAGHSFGPSVILEYLTRYPTGVDGALILSPGGRFSPKMMEHYRTRVMGFLERRYEEAGDHWNGAGDLWADTIVENWTFMKRPPPMIPIRMIVGANDQWFPDMEEPQILANYFPNIHLSIIPGMDHFVFNHEVQKMDPVLRKATFRVEPVGNKPTRFVVWTVVDFLHSQLGIDIPLKPNADVKKMEPVRKALQLNETNPLFKKALAVDDATLLDPVAAARALKLWESVKESLWLGIFNQIESDYPKFYEIHRERIEKVKEVILSGKKVSGDAKNNFLIMLAKLKKSLEESTEQEAMKKRGAFGVPIQTQDGSEGQNHWTRVLQHDLNEAHVAYETGNLPTPPIPSGRWSRLRTRLFGDRVQPIIPYQEAKPVHDQSMEKMQRVRDTFNIQAGTVLSIGRGHDTLEPFRMFDGTERAIIISKQPFGSPTSVKQAFTVRKFAEAYHQMNVPAEGPSDEVGGNFVNQLVAGLGATRLYGIYYFDLNEDGSVRYLNGDQQFANAEVRFEDADGRVKTAVFIQSDFLNPSKNLMQYLKKERLDLILAGEKATDFEIKPKALSQYQGLLRHHNIRFAMGDRRSNYLRGRMSPDRAAFFDMQRTEKHQVDGKNYYIAKANDFLRMWNHQNTYEGTQEFYDQLSVRGVDGLKELPIVRSFNYVLDVDPV